MIKFYSSRLLNKVEKTTISGVAKTSFFTEISTGVSVGTRMFILNGNYDSNDFIRKSRFGKFVDGYRVLRSETNKLTLDIDWSGLPPVGDALVGNAINIWVVRTKSEFDYLNTILVDLYDTRCSKFEYRLTSNVIYTENLVFTNQFFIKGFWAKDGNTWKLISTHFDQGFINYFLPKWSDYGYSTNYKIKIRNHGFVYKNQEFIKDATYFFNNPVWLYDIRVANSFISRLNFRDGIFRGNFQDGIFGSNDKKLVFEAKWFSGITLNSQIKDSQIRTKSGVGESATIGFVQDNIINFFSDKSNNDSYGLSYFFDSTIESAQIYAGNFINCNFACDLNPEVTDIIPTTTTNCLQYGNCCTTTTTTTSTSTTSTTTLCICCDPTPTTTPTVTSTPTLSPTVTKTSSVTPTLTPTSSSSQTPTVTSTGTPTLTPTLTSTQTPGASTTPTPTLTPTITDTPTETPTNTQTPTSSLTPTITDTPTETPTNTQTPTSSLTPTITDTPTETPTSTLTPTITDTPTETSTPVLSPTETQTNTPTETPTNTQTLTPTLTPSITDTPTETPTNTQTPTTTPSVTPTDSPITSQTNTPTITSTPTQTPTNTSSETPTETPTNTPTNTETPTNTSTPTITPSPFVIPSSDPTLQVYYDASDTSTYNPSGTNGTQITQWNDKSATAHNAAPLGAVSTRPTVSSNIQNGLTALYFDQNDDGLEIPGLTLLQGLTGSTIIWVGKTLDSGDNQQILCGADKVGSNFVAVNGFELEIAGSASYIIAMAGGSASSDATLDNNFHVHTILFDGTVTGNSNRLKHRVDGLDRTLTFSSNIGATTSSIIDSLILGADEGLLKDFYGYMGGLLIYTRKLSNTEVTNTENFLKTQWGIL